MIDAKHGWNRSFKPLIWGFFLSLMLILISYFATTSTSFLKGRGVISIIIGCALFQALVQLLFFLHLGIESKPRWNLMTFLFLLLVIVVLVGGSLWIMHNLDYNMMPMPEY